MLAKRILGFSLLLFLLAACGSVMSGPAMMTPNVPPSLAMLTPVPTNSLQPTLMPSVPILSFPEWLKDSTKPVLLVVEYQQPQYYVHTKIKFVEPALGESFAVPVYPFKDVAWTDPTHVLFGITGKVCVGKSAMMSLDLSSGDYSQVTNDFPGLKEYCALQQRYGAYILHEINKGQIEVYDLYGVEPDITLDVQNVQNGERSNLDVQISPIDQTIAVLQGSLDNFRQNGADRIAFYDFAGRLEESFSSSGIDSFHYAQDGKSIIYMKGNLPCKLDLENLISTCGVALERPYDYFYFGGVSNDGRKIISIADDLTRASKVCFEDIQTGKKRCDYMNVQNSLCLSDIFTGETNCPMKNMKDLFWGLDWVETTDTVDQFIQPVRNQRRVIQYLFSPNEEFVTFTYGFGFPNGGNFSDIKRAVIKVDGQDFYDLGESNTDIGAIWRPGFHKEIIP